MILFIERAFPTLHSGCFGAQIKSAIEPEEDSVVLYKCSASPGFEKSVIGQALKK